MTINQLTVVIISIITRSRGFQVDNSNIQSHAVFRGYHGNQSLQFSFKTNMAHGILIDLIDRRGTVRIELSKVFRQS